MHQLTNWEAVFSTQSVRQLRDATLELLKGVSMRFVPRSYKQDKSRIQLLVRESPASKEVNTAAEEATALVAVARRQPVKVQQTEETLCVP
jgi:hypothetical protein